MKKLNYIVQDKNTIILDEDASKGDIIDLTSQISIDTKAIEAKVQEATESAKVKYYQSQLDAEIRALNASKDQEKELACNDLEKEIIELKNKLLAKETEKKNALELKEKEIESKYTEELTKLNSIIKAKDQEKDLALAKADAIKNTELANKDKEIVDLNNKIQNANIAKDLEISKVEMKFNEEISKKNLEISSLNSKAILDKERMESMMLQQAEVYKAQLTMKDEQIAQYKDFKQRLSTKGIGESLEIHCYNEYNTNLRALLPFAYFEKDNDDRDGSKGDFIYRENGPDGSEVISIMFEMKNEMESTETKHKNQDFFKKLDSDRTKKNCEYAVLVSMLEKDNEFYNNGIVPVYQYDKMFVIRPQFFTAIITLLRNSALKAYTYKEEINRMKSAEIDVTNFENKLDEFKTGFLKNYNSAAKNYQDAIDGIDAAIKKLEGIKKSLQTSQNQLNYANNKVEDISVKKLTYNNPTMKKKFQEAKEKEE